jgi:hypothetical protein
MLGDERPKITGSDASDDLGATDRPRRGRPPNQLKMDQPATFTMEQVMQMFGTLQKDNRDALIEFARELKKPSPEEQAKLDKEHAKLKERAAAAVKLAMAEEKGKENAAKFCPHGTTHKGTHVFTHQWRAQVMTPHGEKPYYIPRCTQCSSTWDRVFGLPSPKILATSDQLQGGVNMDQWTDEDIRRVVEWARRNPNEENIAA